MAKTDPKPDQHSFDWRDVADQVETIMSEMAVMVTVQDKKGRLLYANPPAARMLDQDAHFNVLSDRAASLLEKYDIYNESDQLIAIGDLPSRKVLEGDPWAELVQHYVAKDGSKEFWLMVKAVPVKAETGTTPFVITIANDITALKQTEIKLRKNNDRLMSALEGVMESQDFDSSSRRRGSNNH